MRDMILFLWWLVYTVIASHCIVYFLCTLGDKFMNLNRLMKENVEVCQNVEYKPSNRLTDENGNPQVWILRPLTTKEVDKITEKYTKKENVVETNSRGKRKVRQEVKLDSYAVADEMVLASLVEPSLADLENKELQDSWGVLNPTDLLKAILSVPGEYSDLREEVQRICGFDIDAANALTEEAKKN